MEHYSDLTSLDVTGCLKPEPEKNVLHSKADSDLSEEEFNEDVYDENEEIIHEVFDEDDQAETNLSGR